ncbi:MCE family protein [Mycolicibacterium mengxianglii]|uniref:MCE family protein n=1 Tax=Mycolicibacterium mengxianglii TaxID=2736649 RepID=UPI0018D0EB3E|nr:MCE family protein [Mycolicibacterium mengxianglii]
MTAPGQVTSPPNEQRTPPYKLAGVILLVIVLVVVAMVYVQFRGGFTSTTPLTLVSDRAGLVMDPGSKVTYNGVEIGRVAKVDPVDRDGTTKAQLTLDVDPRYIDLIPANVNANIQATTVFGNKYVSFTSPEDPTSARISSADVIDVSGVTTEFNTLFETITSISEQVDPVKLNMTLSATAEALTGLGAKFGQSLVSGNTILDDINPRMPQLRYDLQRLADLSDVYTSASPDLFDALDNAVVTVRSLNEQRGDLDAALLGAVGFGNTGGDVFERGGPYLVRGAHDLVPTAQVLDRNSPALFCTIRNYATAAPKVATALGGNGYSLNTNTTFLGAENPYVYPDNLPRLNAKGGPGGAPGCWQEITRELWPAPYLVLDTGASIAPYNHFELGQPILTEYVWGRQGGENTINP